MITRKSGGVGHILLKEVLTIFVSCLINKMRLSVKHFWNLTCIHGFLTLGNQVEKICSSDHIGWFVLKFGFRFDASE